jgi:CBS domain-containing protein
MERHYHALDVRELGPNAGYRRPTLTQGTAVTLESPALEVMTDLSRVSPATIRPQAPLSGANEFMIARGVRLLLVVDYQEKVLGVLSAADVLGERPMRVSTERGLRRDELTVADVMTPAERVEVVAFEEARGAHVGHVLETLRRIGRTHALVVEFDELPAERLLQPPVKRTMVRGIFSLSQIARQLGIALQPGAEVALSFSDIEAALGR